MCLGNVVPFEKRGELPIQPLIYMPVAGTNLEDPVRTDQFGISGIHIRIDFRQHRQGIDVRRFTLAVNWGF